MNSFLESKITLLKLSRLVLNGESTSFSASGYRYVLGFLVDRLTPQENIEMLELTELWKDPKEVVKAEEEYKEFL